MTDRRRSVLTILAVLASAALCYSCIAIARLAMMPEIRDYGAMDYGFGDPIVFGIGSLIALAWALSKLFPDTSK